MPNPAKPNLAQLGPAQCSTAELSAARQLPCRTLSAFLDTNGPLAHNLLTEMASDCGLIAPEPMCNYGWLQVLALVVPPSLDVRDLLL